MRNVAYCRVQLKVGDHDEDQDQDPRWPRLCTAQAGEHLMKVKTKVRGGRSCIPPKQGQI
jgi:hypothetical protein